jgi:hypothetical protein
MCKVFSSKLQRRGSMVALHKHNKNNNNAEYHRFLLTTTSSETVNISSSAHGDSFLPLFFQKHLHFLGMALVASFRLQRFPRTTTCSGVRELVKIEMLLSDVWRPSRELEKRHSKTTCETRHPPAWYIKISPTFPPPPSFNYHFSACVLQNSKINYDMCASSSPKS